MAMTQPEHRSEPSERKTYAITWQIDGVFHIEASSAAEAELIFNQLSARDLSDDGDLVSGDAKPVERD